MTEENQQALRVAADWLDNSGQYEAAWWLRGVLETAENLGHFNILCLIRDWRAKALLIRDMASHVLDTDVSVDFESGCAVFFRPGTWHLGGLGRVRISSSDIIDRALRDCIDHVAGQLSLETMPGRAIPTLEDWYREHYGAALSCWFLVLSSQNMVSYALSERTRSKE